MSNAGKTVRVHYVGTLDDGTKFDSSRDRDRALAFTCMGGEMIKGFDECVRDMEVGEIRTIHLEPKDAYGEHRPDLVHVLPIENVPGAEDVEKGQRVMLQAPDGRPIPALIAEKDDRTIIFDLNHELAGKALNFEIELLEVK